MFTLKISTANDSFDNEGAEIARILREVAGIVEADAASFGTAGTLGRPIRDVNGNTVGKWELK